MEAKEGVRIENENQTLASITFQNYFRMYHKLAGMTGTADTEAEEFAKTYNLDVMVIPTHMPMIRDNMSDCIYKNEEASNAKTEGGWLRTGDLVQADEGGNLYFVDRKTDSLRRRGENISSWEVEREIDRHPAVLESAVFGVPSELGEHEVMAIVVLKEGQALSPEELTEHLEGRLAKFMVPRYLEFRDSLPKTGTHRVQKGALKREGVGPNTWDREAQQA